MSTEIYCRFTINNHTTTDHKEGEQLEDRRNVGKRSCNFGDGTGQRVQYLTFMMMMMNVLYVTSFRFTRESVDVFCVFSTEN